MAEINEFSGKIQGRIDRHRQELAQKQQQLNGEMKHLLERRDNFNGIARNILSSIIYPRMSELARHFDNAKLTDVDKITDFHCLCEFTHTYRFPALTRLDIHISPSGNYEKLDIGYDLAILPVLIEYQKHDEQSFSLGSPACEEEMSRWVEEKMLDFLDTYLQLETHPMYQKENVVTDPVCGMRIPIAEAAGKIERDGRTIFFCSDICKDAYLKENQ